MSNWAARPAPEKAIEKAQSVLVFLRISVSFVRNQVTLRERLFVVVRNRRSRERKTLP